MSKNHPASLINPGKEAALIQLIRPLPQSIWAAHFPIKNIERQLPSFGGGVPVNLGPDFQRGHVWTRAQQEAFVEALLRGALSENLLTLQFNCPSWDSQVGPECDLPDELQIVDGLQRLTAVRKWIAGEITPFGLTTADLEGTSHHPLRANNLVLRFAVHAFRTRRELLQYYLDINGGGTPHTSEELARVRALLEAA